MNLNPLLKKQIAPLFTSQNTQVTKELLDLLTVISATYDYFENRLQRDTTTDDCADMCLAK